MAPHTGQSSQLVFEANDRNAQFLSTIEIGVDVIHTDMAYHETDRMWIPLSQAA
jgi:hypothetical protein